MQDYSEMRKFVAIAVLLVTFTTFIWVKYIRNDSPVLSQHEKALRNDSPVLSQYEKAIEDEFKVMNEAVERNPESGEALSNRAVAHLRNGRVPEALADL